MSQTKTTATLAVPTAGGSLDAIDALLEASKAGEWILIAPDGRMWKTADQLLMLAIIITASMRGEDLRFGRN